MKEEKRKDAYSLVLIDDIMDDFADK